MSQDTQDTQVDETTPYPQDAQGSQPPQDDPVPVLPVTNNVEGQEPPPKRRRTESRNNTIHTSLDHLEPGAYFLEVKEHPSGALKLMVAMHMTVDLRPDLEAGPLYVAHTPIGAEEQRYRAAHKNEDKD